MSRTRYTIKAVLGVVAILFAVGAGQAAAGGDWFDLLLAGVFGGYGAWVLPKKPRAAYT